ncbi:glycerol-3-phosphate acyltransferase RAM2-like [Triticum dicoccoides]|uniref:glycerol-3-phosphate acyltransferase RAM2-like n=1 Tax=Triticum dicoccoides TaxID=85692 RepID=UPI00189094C8|nr:glycerol-3-phosphate acyltransferase RAM2-like [Triticum dicoccoides]
MEAPFETVDKFESSDSSTLAVASDLVGTLLRSRSSFPYYALVAFEAHGLARLLLLLLLAPLAVALEYAVSEDAGVKVLVFATTAGVRMSVIESAARAVLPHFFATDVHPGSWRVFSACARQRVVLTAMPRVMVEPFLKECLGADTVVGTELSTWRGLATGMVDAHRGVLAGTRKAEALRQIFHDGDMPDVGLANHGSDHPFLSICKAAYILKAAPVEAVNMNQLRKPVIFHDGRLVPHPTPLVALLILLWFPVGFMLACLRIAAGALLPMSWVYYAFWALGVRVVVRGTPPLQARRSTGRKGVLFVMSHRTLLDPIFLSAAIGRPVAAVTYSLSRLSEFLSPIRTVQLSRNRATDAAMIKRLIADGDLAICPEGTTCREPFLLRFSALFAELTDEVVPVAIEAHMGMFHGTSARGWKVMDPFYFFMNPCPMYTVTFLSKLPTEHTCGGGGKSSHEVANYIQQLIGATLSYECTSLTRKDKYMELAGNEGVTAVKSPTLPDSYGVVAVNPEERRKRSCIYLVYKPQF